MSDQGADSLFHMISRGEDVNTRDFFRFELNRLHSYVTWPRESNAFPTSLARTGLYYIGPDDKVACFHCNVHLGHWEKIDLPLAEHERHSPNCGFVRGENVGNVPLIVGSQPFSVQQLRQQEDDIIAQRAAAQSIGLAPQPGAAAGVDSGLLDLLQKQMSELSVKYPYCSFSNQLDSTTRQVLNQVGGNSPDASLNPSHGLSIHGSAKYSMVSGTEASTEPGQSLTSPGGEPTSSGSEATGSTRQELISQAIISISTEPVRQVGIVLKFTVFQIKIIS